MVVVMSGKLQLCGSVGAAEAFLRRRLRYGMTRASVLVEEAERLGISRATLYRAKERLGIPSIRCRWLTVDWWGKSRQEVETDFSLATASSAGRGTEHPTDHAGFPGGVFLPSGDHSLTPYPTHTLTSVPTLDQARLALDRLDFSAPIEKRLYGYALVLSVNVFVDMLIPLGYRLVWDRASGRAKHRAQRRRRAPYQRIARFESALSDAPVIQIYYRPAFWKAPLFRVSFMSGSVRTVLDPVGVRNVQQHIAARLPAAFTFYHSASTFFVLSMAELAYDQPVSDVTVEELLGILEAPGSRAFQYRADKRHLRLGGRTSPVFLRLYHKVEHGLQLTRLEVVVRKPRLQALGVHDINDLLRLDPAALIHYVLHDAGQRAQLRRLLDQLGDDWRACAAAPAGVSPPPPGARAEGAARSATCTSRLTPVGMITGSALPSGIGLDVQHHEQRRVDQMAVTGHSSRGP